MQVKKFEAPTMQEVLENIKRELGPEAIILQTRKNKRGFGLLSKASVEVTVAISERSLMKKHSLESRLSDGKRKAVNEMPADRQADILDKFMNQQLDRAHKTRDRVEVSAPSRKITATRYIEITDPLEQEAPRVDTSPLVSKQSLEEDLRNLRKVVEELKANQLANSVPMFPVVGTDTLASKFETSALQEVFENLMISGVDHRVAWALVKKVKNHLDSKALSSAPKVVDRLAEEMMKTLEIISPFRIKEGHRPQAIALVGPTGVGKTTTLAKMANLASNHRGLKVGLINLDSQRPGVFDQLSIYAKVFNIPFRSAVSEQDIQAALLDFKTLDVILVDVGGCSQKDSSSLRRLEEMFSKIPNLDIFLVLSAMIRDAELYDIANRFSFLNPKGLVISKLDETNVYGSIYNISQKTKLPFAFFTTGQKVPDDIEDATKERVISLIIDI